MPALLLRQQQLRHHPLLQQPAASRQSLRQPGRHQQKQLSLQRQRYSQSVFFILNRYKNIFFICYIVNLGVPSPIHRYSSLFQAPEVTSVALSACQLQFCATSDQLLTFTRLLQEIKVFSTVRRFSIKGEVCSKIQLR